MDKQTTNTVFMVLPIDFSFNTETSVNNTFQNNVSLSNTQEKALSETLSYINLLKENNINILCVSDTLTPHTPDSVFPNNWFMTLNGGKFVLFPMFAKNRRNERKIEFLNIIKQNFIIKDELDLTSYELENKFLEGTGSMVVDRINKIVYASLSSRTNEEVLNKFCETFGYKKIVFSSYDRNNNLIYHTNVMMSIGTDYAIVCLDSIKDKNERKKVKASLKETNKEIIDINYDQLDHFLANSLELVNTNNERILVMSTTAYSTLKSEQLNILKSKCKIITPDIPTIEKIGGGSARCMIAEIFK